MISQPFPMRVIQRVETYLPAFATPDIASARRRRVWAGYAATVPSLAVAGMQLFSHRAELVKMWPAWRSMILDLLMVIAGAALIAAVVAGAVAWSTESRPHA